MMNPTILKTAIKEKLADAGFVLNDENCKSGEFVDILVDEILLHITTYGVVNVSVNTAVTGTLTPPTAVAGTGVGTGTGGIS